MTAFANAEGHCLVRSAPIDVTGCTFGIIHMQEHAVLLLAPFRIDRDAAFGHSGKSVRLRAGAVDIPALENIAGRGVTRIWSVLILRRNISAICNVRLRVNLSHAAFFHRVAITVDVFAVHEVDGVSVTGVVAIDRAGSTRAPRIARRVAKLGEADKVQIVLFFSEEAVIG